MGFVIIIITLYFAPALIPAYFGKNMLLLKLGVILYLVGYFNYFFSIFRFITVIIEIKIVTKLFS